MITAVVVVSNGTLSFRKEIDPEYKHCTIPVVFDYLAEGAANVVFRLVPFAKASRIACPPEIRGKLLRVRKDKSFIAPTQVQHDHFKKTFAPLFDPKHLIDTRLVSIERGLLAAFNSELRLLQREGIRHTVREGDVVAEHEPYASLITDMSAVGPEVTIEFKPKWLLQSPDAPIKARRCRTCALRAMRAKTSGLSSAQAEKEGYCPLSLLSRDKTTQLQAAKAILKSNKMEWLSTPEEAFSDILAQHVRPVLEKLEQLQSYHGREGIFFSETPSSDYLIAMTLRDCALFIRAPDTLDPSGPIEVRLADLDAKTPHPDKIKKWRDTELALLREGWYENTEEGAVPESICILTTQLYPGVT